MDLVKNMPRDFKRLIGEEIAKESSAIMILVFRANVAQDKEPYLLKLIERLQVIELMIRLSEKRMTRPAILIGLPLSQTFVPGLQKAVAALRQHQPKAKDAELLEQIFIAGLKATLDSPAINKERIVRGR